MAVALVAVVLHLLEAGLDLADVRDRGTVRLALVVLVLLRPLAAGASPVLR